MSPPVHEQVAASRARAPGAEAVRFGEASWTYAELDGRANRFARYLIKCGVTPGTVVAVVLDPSFELLFATLGIFKAGAVYLPVEAGYPLQRRRQMIADAGALVAIMPGAHAWDFAPDSVRPMCLEAERDWIDREPDLPPGVTVADNDLAYLIYTSGSTGEPKGVMLEHGPLAAKLSLDGAWGTVTPRTRCPVLGSIAFDAALAQMLLPLAHGGTTVLLTLEERLDPFRLWPALSAGRATLLDCTPSWLAPMLDNAPADLPVERLVLGGETLPPTLAASLAALWPRCRIVNAYGPTEACIDAAAHEVGPGDAAREAIPIGRALPGYRLSVHDASGAPVEPGVTGELWIGGIGLARGYWRRPVDSAARFVGEGPARCYRTGDLVTAGADGTLLFRGRIDAQVKIRGQRVEPDEIARVIERDGAVASAIVMLRDTGGTEQRLVAYLVPCRGTARARALSRIREMAAASLPAHMVPSRWMWLDRLPLTATGKLDRQALPLPPDARRAGAGPRDATERFLCDAWGDVLGIADVGIHENFFELGGHSLLCALVIARINRRFDLHLPLVAMFASPSVADMAVTVTRRSHGNQARRLVRLNAADGGPPLFCLPPLSGVGTVYAGLARQLATPVYALQATGLTSRPPGTTGMDELARLFLAEMRTVQPRGPYHLCAYSAGAVIAVRMAEQLCNTGESTAAMLLIDPYCDEPDPTVAASDIVLDRERRFWIVCRELLGDMGIVEHAADRMIEVAQRLWREHLSQPDGDARPSEALLARLRDALGTAMDAEIFIMMLEGTRNIWGAYDGHVLPPMAAPPARCWIAQPDQDAESARAARLAIWRTLVGDGLQQCVIVGAHETMLSRARSVDAIAGLAGAMLAAPGAPADG